MSVTVKVDLGVRRPPRCPPPGAYVEILQTGRSWHLGGNVHDPLIAMTCAAHGLPLATLDRRQATLAHTRPRLDVTLLLSAEQLG